MGILVLASSASIMSTDIYAPSLPHLPALFDTSASMVQLTISLNVLMFGLGQLFLGPLSDRFGRKPVLLTAILLFTLFSFCLRAGAKYRSTHHRAHVAGLDGGGGSGNLSGDFPRFVR